ncbi:MAG: hypothetical protein PHF46_04430 [Candidatus Gracilibacteria bacterium]|nr:hypothetical protein [Candidatus Gracilibacteria bacterium]
MDGGKKLKVRVIFSKVFFRKQKDFDSHISKEDVLQNIKRFLEGKRRNGEVFLPNPSGNKYKGLVLFKIKCKGLRVERGVVCFIPEYFNVIPIFFASKTNNIGENIGKFTIEKIVADTYLKIIDEIENNQKGLDIEDIILDVDRIQLHGFTLYDC